MSIINIQTAPPTGQAAVTSQVSLTQSTLPSLIYIQTTDTYATVTTTGYLTGFKQEGFTFSNNQMALVYTTDDGPIWLQVAITYSGASVLNTVVSLVEPVGPGDVVLPTIAHHIATYTNTSGTISEDPSIAISGGSIQAGLSGTAGTFISYPATTSKGSLVVAAVANTGNTVTTISNDAMGQASVINVPDPANAIGQLLIGATATPFVSGNFPVNSGTAGLMVDSGIVATNLVSKIAANTFSGSGQIILAKVNGTEGSNLLTASGNAGLITTSSLTVTAGSTYVITWTNTKITSTSVIGLTIQGGTNTNQNITFTCVPGSSTATLTIFNNAPSTSISGTIFIGYTVL
jgi:hypothetical protein